MLKPVNGWHGGLGGGGRRALNWWLAELGGMLPEWLRNTLAPGRERILLRVADGQISVQRESAAQHGEPESATLAGDDQGAARRLASSGGERVLCLPTPSVLRRRVELPLATEENLRQVLGFELDRETPLSSEQAYFDYRLLERDTARRRLVVELLVVPQAVVEEACRHLEALGLAPHRATVSDSDGSPLDVNLLPEPQRARFTRLTRVLNLGLLVLALALGVVAAGLPLYQQRAVLDEIEPLVREARAAATTTRELRDSLEQLSAEARFVLDKRREATPVLDLMNEVTQTLPDDTWLRQLILAGGELQLMGESANAELLVQLLDASPLLRSVRFRSPVVQDPNAGIERFHLSAEFGAEGTQ